MAQLRKNNNLTCVDRAGPLDEILQLREKGMSGGFILDIYYIDISFFSSFIKDFSKEMKLLMVNGLLYNKGYAEVIVMVCYVKKSL